MVLKAREEQGLIQDLQIHPRFKLEVNGQKIATAIYDFSYRRHCWGTETQQWVIEDVKGYLNKKSPIYSLWKLKATLFEASYPASVFILKVKIPSSLSPSQALTSLRCSVISLQQVVSTPRLKATDWTDDSELVPTLQLMELQLLAKR